MEHCINVYHKGLNKRRRISGSDEYVVKRKAKVQKALWDEMWREKQIIKKQKKSLYDKKDDAAKMTARAKKALDDIESILTKVLKEKNKVDWDKLKLADSFAKPKPNESGLLNISMEPRSNSSKYKPDSLSKRINIFFRELINVYESIKDNKGKVYDFSVLQKKILNIFKKPPSGEHLIKLFEEDYRKWALEKKKTEETNIRKKELYKENLKKWELEKNEFFEEQKKNNDAIDRFKKRYSQKEVNAIIEFCDLVLANSNYPEFVPQDFALDYNPNNKMLIVEYFLPALDKIPTLKEVKYVKSNDELKEYHLSESKLKKTYDDLLYNIILRSIYELFKADCIGSIELINFNGWVKYIDVRTGQDTTACILSIQCSREEFLEINLGKVDPKACFKNLKGISAAKLYGLSPIKPILQISREDNRFVSSYDVANSLDDATNIAVMSWEDFEHLIRELFEKEFNQVGGEVKVTQASRDGGVDAIAFDPDPIRGGKIVIQAKRYTNVVGVSAVRDLYGTVMHEGATKGILITTADYGKDAYNFIKGKPLTLLSGNHLLHLLEKHGHKAKIDLVEAKKILAEQEKI